jgi:antibiotic biosynthesis monooxygenase (ABM) superfamily enzyme
MTSSDLTPSGATVVITHRVRDGRESDYDNWLNEIGPLCRASPGHLDWQIIRPIAGLTTTYTVIIRFDTPDHLRQWMGSPERQRLIETVRPLLATDDDYTIRSGLDFWFTAPGAGVKVPVRWKQFLITWSAIYPLVLGVSLVVVPVLRQLGAPDNRFLTTLLVTATVVLLMVYVIMPRYTSLVRQWLFHEPK